MKVLHVCYRFFPDRGGSETYTSNLIRGLKRVSVDSTVVCLAESARKTVWEQVPVWGIAYGAQSELGEIINEVGPDLIHFHFRPAAPLKLINPRSIPTVFTLHHPSTICLRGTLIRNGNEICSGE